MPGASLPSTDGLADWIDNTHNWRAQDAEFLQERSVLRFSNVSTRNSVLGPSTSIPTPTAGLVTYISATDKLQYSTSTGAWRDIQAFQYLTVDDQSTGVGLRLSPGTSNSVTLETNQVALGTNRSLVVSPTSLAIKTGAATVTLTTDSTSLVSNAGISAPSGSFTSLTTTGINNGSSALTTGSVTASGAITAGSLNVSSGASALNTVTATSLVASGTVQSTTVYGTTSVRGGSVSMADTKVSAHGSTTSFLQLESSFVKISGDSVVLAPTSPTTAIRYNSAGGPPLAVVVISASDPGAANYPEGTIWIRPS